MQKRTKRIILFTSVAFLFALSLNVALAGATLENPLGEGVTDPREIIGNIIKAMLGITGSLALAVFIFGGFTWVISAGNEEKIEKGKKMVMWAAFGLAVIFFSYAIVNFIVGAVVGTGTNPSTAGQPTATGAGQPD